MSGKFSGRGQRITFACIVIVLIPLFLLMGGCRGSQKYIESVKQNTDEWEVKGVIWYKDAPQMAVKGDTTGVCSPSLQESYAKVCRKEKFIAILTNQGETCYFSILDTGLRRAPCGGQNLKIIFAKSRVPNYNYLFGKLQPGTKVRIPTSKPLSRFAEVYSVFIYFEGEKIPHLDFVPIS
ncbi:hypothetical protein KKF32_01205 [Patescibacteria group bacterium]|nr:hypothetical protein [Patescibacteria group bacterium]